MTSKRSQQLPVDHYFTKVVHQTEKSDILASDDNLNSSSINFQTSSSTCSDFKCGSGCPPTASVGNPDMSSYPKSYSNSLDIANALNTVLTDSQKMDFLLHFWKPNESSKLHTCTFKVSSAESNKVKCISFQRIWFSNFSWLAYSEVRPGGWCVPCVLFSLKDKQETSMFVTSPFTNYNKSTELLRRHEEKLFHQECMKKSCEFKKQFENPNLGIDVKINQQSEKNLKRNCNILPHIIDAVLLCAQQGLPLVGSNANSLIDFANPPQSNEGNFLAILRLLAERDHVLKDYLISGPKNGKYIHTDIQNEIIQITADLIRQFISHHLKICPHFSIMADEVTSHNDEILSICIRFLEIQHRNKPIIHEMLLDFEPLARITGAAISQKIQENLSKHSINIHDCKGQAYDTTSSMSSINGVQGLIKNIAPDADYQGCLLHSLNLAITHTCSLSQVRNMIDTCHQIYLYFDNSPKRQSFLETVIKSGCPKAKILRIQSLSKTRWTARHATYDTIFALYPFLLQALEQIVCPIDLHLWSWDNESRIKANGLRHILLSFEFLAAFFICKEYLEPLASLSSALQGQHMEIYLAYKKVDDIITYYKHLRETVDNEFEILYGRLLDFAKENSIEESAPRQCSRQTHRSNIPSFSVMDYWKTTIAIPFLDHIIMELTNRFDGSKRAHFELFSLIPELAKDMNVEEIQNILYSKWHHILPAPDSLYSELNRWKFACQSNIENPLSITAVLATICDAMLYPNVRELLMILCVLPVGSVQAERSFSCLRRIHSWLRNSMTVHRLGNLAVIAMHAFSLSHNLSKDMIAKRFTELHPRRMKFENLLSQ